MDEASYFLRFFNLLLRAINLVGKFAIIFFLAKYLTPDEVGLYGLLVATITYSMFPLGLEFYTYSTRKIIASKKSKWGWLIKSQASLYLRVYFVFLPFFSIIFITGFLPWRMAPWFFLLLIFEHINQEMMRLLIVMSRQIQASISILVRQGLWAIPALLYIYLFPDKRNLEFILAAWLAASVCAFFFSALTIYKLPISGWHLPVDWKSIKAGIKISSVLLVANLSMNLIWTSDKYWFKYLQGSETLGAYVFYLSLASSFLSFLDASVFSFIYPRMIRVAEDGNMILLKKYTITMINQTILLFLLFFTVACLSIMFVLEHIGRNTYIEHIKLFYFSLAAVAVYATKSALHYALYALKKDKEIAKINIMGVVFFIMSTGFFSLFNTYVAVSAGICSALLLMLLLEARIVIKQFDKSKVSRKEDHAAQSIVSKESSYDA